MDERGGPVRAGPRPCCRHAHTSRHGRAGKSLPGPVRQSCWLRWTPQSPCVEGQGEEGASPFPAAQASGHSSCLRAGGLWGEGRTLPRALEAEQRPRGLAHLWIISQLSSELLKVMVGVGFSQTPREVTMPCAEACLVGPRLRAGTGAGILGGGAGTAQTPLPAQHQMPSALPGQPLVSHS